MYVHHTAGDRGLTDWWSVEEKKVSPLWRQRTPPSVEMTGLEQGGEMATAIATAKMQWKSDDKSRQQLRVDSGGLAAYDE
jgi:hypothetical protein